ncbi:ribonuclease III [Candidatus Zixiibacteriota bacterium]
MGYRFHDTDLLREALSHRSFVGVRGEDRLESNERLEFLGDAILDLVVAHELFQRFPRKSEGELTELKSLLVSRPTLERTARDLGLGEALLLSQNEDATGGRTRPSILADAFEALLGALYIDGGYEVVRRIVVDLLIHELAVVSRNPALGNYKSKLLEYVQKQKNGRLIYRTTGEKGPDHDKIFIIQVLLDQQVLGEGRGESKKQAQQEAARAALEKLGVVDINGQTLEVDDEDGQP